MDLDLRDDLDRCFDDGPPVDDTDRLLERGRTALRRRRLTEGMSVLAVAAVVAVAALAATGAGPGAASPDHPPVASSPAAEAAASVSFTIVSDPSLPERLPPRQLPVELLASHQLRVGPGVELQQILIDPYDPAVYPASVGLAYRRGGATFWHLQYVHGDGSQSGATQRASAGGDFDAWVADQVKHPSPSVTSVMVDPGLPADDPVTVDSGAGLHVAPDVRIVRIVTNPFHRVAPGASTAAMYVRDGAAFWFVASVSGTGGATATSAAGHDFDTWVADHVDMPEIPDGGQG